MILDQYDPGLLTKLVLTVQVRNDKLDLRVPEWVSTIGFVPDTGDQPTLAVATGYHQASPVIISSP